MDILVVKVILIILNQLILQLFVHHNGVLVPQSHNFSARLYNRIAPLFLADTGSQFFLRDKVGEFGKPLLVWMADPRSKFYKALAKFKYKSLYANVVNDKRCSWYTASISPMIKLIHCIINDQKISIVSI